jgi:cell division septum initiation protein DivIVA
VARTFRYDREQVDAFLVRLSGEVSALRDLARQAMARVDELEAELGRARAARDAAQSEAGSLLTRIAALKARDPQADRGRGDAYRSVHILRTARATADAITREAAERAQGILDAGGAQAAAVLAGAESDAAQLRLEVEVCISELGRRRRLEILAELSVLERARDEASDEIVRFERELLAIRAELALVADALGGLADAAGRPVIDLTSPLILDPPPDAPTRERENAITAPDRPVRASTLRRPMRGGY